MDGDAISASQRHREAQEQLALFDENYEAALEHFPEGFGSVVMLYIRCQVNIIVIAELPPELGGPGSWAE